MKFSLGIIFFLTTLVLLSSISAQPHRDNGLDHFPDTEIPKNFSDGAPTSITPKKKFSCQKNCALCNLQTFDCRICADGFYPQEVRLRTTPKSPISAREPTYQEPEQSLKTICAPCISGCRKCFGPGFFDCYDLQPATRQTPEGSIERCDEISGCNQCNFQKPR